MRHKVIIAALSACLLLSSCGVNESDRQYKVTLYSGGVVVREWDDVSSYTRWSDSTVELTVDGESFFIGCGTFVIESSKD